MKRYWGFDELRPIQAEAIQAGLDSRDSLVVMPTGGGKSLCYQVPPLIRDRLAVVVSPLISLMKDQVDGLRLNGYPAAALHSNLDAAQVRDIERELSAGSLRLLFVSPERLLTPWFLDRITALGINSISIDEAHCISQWGHDFRPEYRRLAELRDRFPRASFHAYTATATPRVQQDICDQLHLRDPKVLVGVFDRPNLTYRIVPRVNADEQIMEVLARHRDQATIIYCISRKDTEGVAAMISSRGVPAKAYHAGMDGEDRRAVQEEFAQERLNVVVATVAFGMGIDRSNVRCVLHANMPKTIEAYQQETGRAGRDGLEAECVLLYSAADPVRWSQLMERSANEAGTETAMQALEVQRQLLDRMHRFCAGMQCRHRGLSEYFGQAYKPGWAAEAGTAAKSKAVTSVAAPTGCGGCDVCLGEIDTAADAIVIAQKILSCVARMNQGTLAFGAAHIIDVLRGSRSEKVLDHKHDLLSTHGLLKELPKAVLASYINQLVDQGALARSPGEYPVLLLNPASREVMRGARAVTLLTPKQPAERPRRALEMAGALGPFNVGLFESLRMLRRGIAQQRAVPAYLVFSDTTLQDLARVRPTTRESLLTVRGVGQQKATEFGERFLEHITSYCAGRELSTDQVSQSQRPERVTGPERRPGRPAPNREPRIVPDGDGMASAPARKSRPSPGRSNKPMAFEMFAKNAGIEEVMEATGLARSTIGSYLGEFVEACQPPSLDPWIDPDTQLAIAKVFERLGTERLKPIYDHFDGRITYDEIRIVVGHARAHREDAAPAEPAGPATLPMPDPPHAHQH